MLWKSESNNPKNTIESLINLIQYLLDRTKLFLNYGVQQNTSYNTDKSQIYLENTVIAYINKHQKDFHKCQTCENVLSKIIKNRLT